MVEKFPTHNAHEEQSPPDVQKAKERLEIIKERGLEKKKVVSYVLPNGHVPFGNDSSWTIIGIARNGQVAILLNKPAGSPEKDKVGLVVEPEHLLIKLGHPENKKDN